MAIAASIMLWCATPQQAAADTYEKHEIASVQQQKVKTTGTVVDQNGEAMIGVSVKVKDNATMGAITDLEGKFSIDTPKGATLEISYIGYKTVTVKAEGTALNITMQEDAEVLDEVVIVGYGSQKKVNVTGAVSMVDSKVIESRPVSNVSQALQGVVPGLNLTVPTAGGALDAGMNISIRGAGTIGDGSSSSPLILIDGMEGDMNSINPNDIENISVLKDAAASSIYGSRAPFGVILITTKSGKAGRTSVNYSTNVRFKSPMSMPEMMDSWSFANYWNEAGINQNGNIKFTQDVMDKILAFQQGTLTGPDAAGISWQDGEWKKYAGAWANTDWFKEQYHSIVSNEHNISVNGGTDKVTYMVSAGYMGDKGLTRHGDDRLTRYNLSGKINATLSKYVKLMYNTKFIREDYDRPSYLTSNFYHNIARRWPTNPVKDANGYYLDHSEIIQMEEGGRDVTQKDQFYQQIQLVVEPLKDWLIHAEGNMKIVNNQNQWEVLPVYYHDGEGSPVAMAWFDGYTPGMSRVNQSYWKDNNYSLNLYTDYFKQIGDHYFKVMGGFNAELYKRTNLSGQRDELITPDVPTLNTGTTEQKANGGYSHWANAGFFGRINYSYKGKYLFNGSFRRDGSSAFAYTGNQWQNFYSIGAGWLMTEEEFMKDITWLDMLKLKGSWGTLGNQNMDKAYPAEPLLENAFAAVFGKPAIIYPGYQLAYLPNPRLRWEKVEAWETGFETNMFRNRFHFEGVYYKKNTKDLLATVPGLSGTVPGIGNLGEIENKGVELMASWRDQIGDWGYSVSANLTTISNKVKSLVQDGYSIIAGDKSQSYTMAGYPIGYFYGYKVAGVYQNQAEIDASPVNTLATVTPGDLKFADVNGDGKITPDDRTKIGDPTPDVTYGISLGLSYKNWELSMEMMGQGGNQIYRTWDNYNWAQFNYMEQRLDRWHGEGTSNTQPLLNTKHAINSENSEYFIEDGSFFRIRNLQLAYSFDKTLLSKIRMQALKVYVNIQNLKTWKHNTGYTPEIGGSAIAFGVDNGTYPVPAVYTFGINLTF